MSPAVWIPTLVALTVGVATILAARHWGTRRRRAIFQHESAPLLPANTRDGLLEMTYRNIAVPNPHLVTIRLLNLGPSDISTQSFDAGAPVHVDLGCTFYGLTSSSHPSVTCSPGIGADGWIELRPTLLRRKEEWAVQAVVSGEAAPELRSSLIDTDFIEAPSARDQLTEFFGGLVVKLPFGISLSLPSKRR